MWKVAGLAFAIAVALVPTSAQADSARSFRGQERGNPFMRVYGSTLPPYGYVRFCQTHSQECKQGPLEEGRFTLTRERYTELDEINRLVNKLIEPVTDLELYGETERWTIPTTKGDCEDYALLKRKLLMARGWPASSMLMTVVRDEKGEGHAILTARTMQGDFVLDNKADDIRVWHKAPYSFVMRQSYIDPNVWVSLDPKDASQPQLLSGVRPRE